MKRILYFITLLIIFLFSFITTSFAEDSSKILALNYDNASNLIHISTKDFQYSAETPIKIQKLTNPNRIYFDIQNAILIGEKQQLIFEKSSFKEIRLAQFSTSPNIVRVVITFEEDFDTSKIKIQNINGNLFIKTNNLKISNDYFNPIYDETPEKLPYLSITANSQFVEKVEIPVSTMIKTSGGMLNEIQHAFGNTTLSNTNGKTYDSVISLDISSKLKMRTKYYINQYQPQNNGLLISGIGQLTTGKVFYLNAPKRVVIDLPNTFLDKKYRNREINICQDGSCKDSAKIGQFEYNTARIVITTDSPEKYIPIYSSDSESLFIINSDKLNHTSLVGNISNLNKVFVKKIDSKTSELILSFTTPIVHSIIRNDNSFNLYLFNVKSYNEADITKTLAASGFKDLKLSLLPQIGIKASINLNKTDIIKVEQSVDAKALKITLKKTQPETKSAEKPIIKKGDSKNKIVLDAGHGGSDYGAIREGINEKDITLDVTKRVESLLRSKGYNVIMTRKDDTFVSLEDRVNISKNEAPQIFVSIHVNSAVSKEPYGSETHYYHEYSKELATVVNKHLAQEISTKDRGLFKSMFYVINHTTVPAILVEIGFISNDNERNELITDKRKQATAKAIADGIIEYLKGRK